ncbi:MAG: Maf family protein, partial [Alphaproteobacteria bacterium]|nr:Maf family protein [Alphaproteobacteria bacterium]
AEVRPAAVDEGEIKGSFKAAGGSAGEAAIALAELKAGRIAATASPAAIVLGSDQILTCEGDWYDKPPDLAAARAQLQSLSGKPHELHTAAVAFRNGARIWHHLTLTRLWMRELSPDFLDRYLDAVGDDVLMTVGGYHIERLGPHLFARIEGDHFSILGLPLLPTLAFLREQGAIAA